MGKVIDFACERLSASGRRAPLPSASLSIPQPSCSWTMAAMKHSRFMKINKSHRCSVCNAVGHRMDSPSCPGRKATPMKKVKKVSAKDKTTA